MGGSVTSEFTAHRAYKEIEDSRQRLRAPYMISTVARINFGLPKTNGASSIYCRVYAYTSSLRPHVCVNPGRADFSALLGETITGVIRPSQRKYRDCVFGGRRTCSLEDINVGMGGATVRPIWTHGHFTACPS